jgi:PTS system mannose-specific IIA component
MIGLVLVTHGDLALEFRKALEHVVGEQTAIECICIGADDDMEQRRLDIVSAVDAVRGEEGVVVLTDMFGGTPSNLSLSVMETGSVEVLAGINLPMLIKLTRCRQTKSLAESVEQAAEAGRKYITVASAVLAS